MNKICIAIANIIIQGPVCHTATKHRSARLVQLGESYRKEGRKVTNRI